MAIINAHQTNKKHRFILKPKEATFSDLLHLLFTTGDITDKKFIYAIIDESEKLLERKAIIFLSLLVQKGFQKISKPLSSYGSRLESWLNGGLLAPNKDSADYKSAIGFLDERVELDKNTKPGDKRYFIALSAMASKLAYENKAFIKTTVEARWEMELLGDGAYDFYNDYQEKFSTQGFLFHDKKDNQDMIIVAFRGTEPFDADSWCSDVDISHLTTSRGDVRIGFLRALGLQKDKTWDLKNGHDEKHRPAYHTIRDVLKRFFEANHRTKFIVTGHSLGGALAVLFPAVLALENEDQVLSRLEAVYTFGQPRVGDKDFANSVKKLFYGLGVKYYRFVYSHDIVPRLPFDTKILMKFHHFGTCVYYNTFYEAKIVEEEPDKNYFNPKSIITNRLDALWEIERSFLLPCMFGPDYREAWLLRVFRILFSLLAPGVVAHGPNEYINAVRLGNGDVFDWRFEGTTPRTLFDQNR